MKYTNEQQRNNSLLELLENYSVERGEEISNSIPVLIVDWIKDLSIMAGTVEGWATEAVRRLHEVSS